MIYAYLQGYSQGLIPYSPCTSSHTLSRCVNYFFLQSHLPGDALVTFLNQSQYIHLAGICYSTVSFFFFLKHGYAQFFTCQINVTLIGENVHQVQVLLTKHSSSQLRTIKRKKSLVNLYFEVEKNFNEYTFQFVQVCSFMEQTSLCANA